MRHLFILVPVLALSFASCASVNRGNYDLGIRSANSAKIEVVGSLYLSAFISWRDTQYGEPPISLIENVIRSEFGKLGFTGIAIRDVRSTKYENSNEIGYSAVVVLNSGSVPPGLPEMRGEFPVERKARSK